MLVRNIVLLINFVLLSVFATGQNYIGMHKDEIKRVVPAKYSGFVFDKFVDNGERSFVKFVNQIDEQTLLFMVNSQGICKSVSRMYNTWMYNDVSKDLSKMYRKTGKDEWMEQKDGKTYVIRLKRSDWFITVTIRPN